MVEPINIILLRRVTYAAEVEGANRTAGRAIFIDTETSRLALPFVKSFNWILVADPCQERRARSSDSLRIAESIRDDQRLYTSARDLKRRCQRLTSA